MILKSGLLIIRRKKSEISRDLRRQIRGENGQFHVNFARIFWGKFVLKSKQKNQKERYLSKRNWKDFKFRARKKHKSSSNTVLKATVLVSSDKKNNKLYRDAWLDNLLFQLQFRAENGNLINFFSLIALLYSFAVFKARLFVIKGSNPCEASAKSKHSCVFYRVLHVRLNMCLHYHRQQFPFVICIVSTKRLLISRAQFFATSTPGSFGTLFTRGSGENSR